MQHSLNGESWGTVLGVPGLTVVVGPLPDIVALYVVDEFPHLLRQLLAVAVLSLVHHVVPELPHEFNRDEGKVPVIICVNSM